MWDLHNGVGSTFCLPEYKCPKYYWDFHQVKWHQESGKILNSYKRIWPPPNYPRDKESDKPIMPIRQNFIDDYIKWSKSFMIQKKVKKKFNTKRML